MHVAVVLQKSQDEIQDMPLVELAYEILKAKGEPLYFRDLMREVQALRGMTDEEAMEVIARLYTEINIDGRFVCIGQNVWGLKRWYPVDKVAERTLGGKRFVRRTGDAFSDDDEDLDIDEYEEDLVGEEESEDSELYPEESELDTGDAELEDDFDVPPEDDADFIADEEDVPLDEEPLIDEEMDEDRGEDRD
jgi:DNA-directed RNA polymerase subunit delta